MKPALCQYCIGAMSFPIAFNIAFVRVVLRDR